MISLRIYHKRFKRGVYLIIIFLLYASLITGHLVQATSAEFEKGDSESQLFLVGFFVILLYTAYVVLNSLSSNPLGKIRKINLIHGNFFTLFMVLIVLQIMQGIYYESFRQISIIPKYLFFGFIIFLLEYNGIGDIDKNIKFIKKAAYYFSLLYIFMYMIAFLRYPSFIFRDLRIQIFFGNAVEDGGAFSILFPFLVFRKFKRETVKLGIMFTAFFLFLFMNGTRASIAAISITIILYILSKVYSNKRVSHGRISFVIIMIIIFSLFVSKIGLISNSLSEVDKSFTLAGIKKSFSGDASSGNLSVRIANIWAPMINRTIKRAPFLGFGNGSWKIESQEEGLMGKNRDVIVYHRAPHNAFLVYYVDWGIIGLLIMIYFYYTGFRNSLSNIINTKDKLLLEEKMISLGAWIAMLFWALTGNSHSWTGWTFFSFIMAYSTLVKHKDYLRRRSQVKSMQNKEISMNN